MIQYLECFSYFIYIAQVVILNCLRVQVLIRVHGVSLHHCILCWISQAHSRIRHELYMLRRSKT